MDTLYYLFGTLIFIAVVLFIEGAYLTWNSSKGPEANRIARRLRIMSAGSHAAGSDVSIVKERLLSESPTVQRLLMSMPRAVALDRLLQQIDDAAPLPRQTVVMLTAPEIQPGAPGEVVAVFEPLLPKARAKFAASIPGATSKSVPGTSHHIQNQRPDVVIDTIRAVSSADR